MKYIKTRFTALFLAFILILGLIPSAPVAVEAAQTVQIGDYIFFGAYNGQPILWRVISLDEKGDPLLFSEKLLSFKDFDAPGAYHGDSDRQEYGSNYWKDSNIRQWLNSSENVIDWIQNDPSLKNVMYNPYDTEKGFLADGNFTAAERKAIKPGTHKALLDEADEYKKDGGTEIHQRMDDDDFVLNYDDAYYQNVTDSVFFLSVKELKEYVMDRGWDKIAAPTEEAVLKCTDKDASLDSSANWRYFLRTPAAEWGNTVRIVEYMGVTSRMTTSREPNYNTVGVRPALYLNLSEITLKAGSGTLRNPYMTEEQVRQQSAQPIQVGDYVRFGHYYGRPITWRVINMDENGDPLLFSDKILSFKAFDTRGGYHQDDERKKNGSNYWPDSNLRQWLNSSESTVPWIQNAPSKNNVMYNPYDTEKGFLADGNFTAAERNAIKPVTHKALLSETDKAKKEGGTELHKYEGYYTTRYDNFIKEAVQNYDKAYYKNVTDSVFLLSVKEFIEYVYGKELGYLAVPTGEALENSPELVKASTEHWDTAMSTDRAVSWMLRTPQASSSDMVRMLEVLGMGVTDISADTGACGVRPALYLKLSGLQKYGFGTEDYPYTIVAGTDISTGKDAPDPQQPSSWAEKDIDEAVKLGIVESHMAFSYTKPIRRSELAELLVNLYYLKSGKSVERIVSEKGWDLKVSPFTDTADEDVILASKLGMLQGKSGDIFDPNGSVTLQEASLVLVNTAKAMGVNIPGDVAGSIIQGEQASGAFITREQAFAAALQLYKLPAAPAPVSGSGGTSASTSKINTVGNTSGNLTNSGHIAQQGDWIYYSNEADGGKLYKSRTDGTGITKLRDERPAFINVVGDWVYYTGRGGIHKVRTDGTEPTQVYIKGSGIYVTGDWIYYLDNGLYKIRTDGTERTKLADNCAGMTLSGDWIYYTNYVPVTNPNVFTPKSSEEGNLYKIRTDGTGKIRLNSDDCRSINVAGDWIYYANYDDGSNIYLKLYKIRTDGTGRTKVSDDSFGNFAYGINVSGDWIYYHNSSTPPGTLCKVKTDGTGKTKLTDDSCAWINVIGDWIYYSSGGKAYKVRMDGTARQIAW